MAIEEKTLRKGRFTDEGGKRHEKFRNVQDQSLMMEKSGVMIMDWTDKEQEE